MFASKLNTYDPAQHGNLVQQQDTINAPAPGQAGLFIATEGPDLTTKPNRNFCPAGFIIIPRISMGVSNFGGN